MTIVIAGCGIIGISTAYQLLELGHPGENIHIIEASSRPFSGASGSSGGFLASNWYSSTVLPLGQLSFALHRQLAEKHSGYQNWGYANSTGISLGSPNDESDENQGSEDWLFQGTSRAQVAERNDQSEDVNDNLKSAPDWLRIRKSQRLDVLSEGDSTAQVDPLRLCSFLLSYCQSKKVSLHQSCTVLSLNTDILSRKMVSIALLDGTSLPCTHLLLTCGPWTPHIFKALFPSSSKSYKKVKVGHLGGHSIVVRSPHWNDRSKGDNEKMLGCHAVFGTSTTTSKQITGSDTFAPEIFSRYPDEIYIAGLNSSIAVLPERADQRVNDRGSIETLKKVAIKMLHLADAQDVEVVRSGFCFRPTTSTGRPYIARIPDKALISDCSFVEAGGVWVSAGHGPWGISLSQGTGKVLAEMVLGRKPTINLDPFAL